MTIPSTRQFDDPRRHRALRIGKRVDHAGSGQGGRGALVANRANPRGAAQLDEVFLKAEIAVLGIETGRDA